MFTVLSFAQQGIETMRSIHRFAACSLAATVLLGTAGCSTSSSVTAKSAVAGAPVIIDSNTPASLFDGVQLGKPFTKPDFTLTDAEGQSYDFAQQTNDKLTLLYFGYTHCPDVCPTTMADLAAALRALPAAESAKITVVFVTTDPGRDTPAVLHAWLGMFDPAFVGLTGSFAITQKAASAVGIPIFPAVKGADGNYTVTHGAEVLAFNTDDEAHVVYTAGTTVAQYDHDLPLLLAGRDI
jgi:protein SCO1/2